MSSPISYVKEYWFYSIYILHYYHDIYQPSYISLNERLMTLRQTKYKWGRVIKKVTLGASAPAKRHDVPEKPRLIFPFFVYVFVLFLFFVFYFLFVFVHF